jgi:hypothetical protein
VVRLGVGVDQQAGHVAALELRRQQQPCRSRADDEDLEEKDAVLAAGKRGVFTITHFDGYPAVLIQLKAVGTRVLRDAIVDGWLAAAPAALADEFVASGGLRRR